MKIRYLKQTKEQYSFGYVYLFLNLQKTKKRWETKIEGAGSIEVKSGLRPNVWETFD